jgi:alanine racemase
MSSEAVDQASVLTIDLGAIAANWRLLAGRLRPGAQVSAVVKADAYGLGAAKVAPALARAGCVDFFVATFEEGLELKPLLPQARLYVLAGPASGAESRFIENGLIPVLNTAEQVEGWLAASRGRFPSALHVDTGMNRLGLAFAEAKRLGPKLAKGSLVLAMSHLACSEEVDHPLNHAQLGRFRDLLGELPGARASLANSSGIFLGSDYHFDLVRPGAALYGVNPTPQAAQPMAQVVHLQGRILQVRDVDTPATVGYGATHAIGRKSRIATVAAGYADGYPRSLSGRGEGDLGGKAVPLVGRVSMDLITFDVTDGDPAATRPGGFVDLIGPRNPVDAVAERAGTIGYEILTRLGRRYQRRYVGE